MRTLKVIVMSVLLLACCSWLMVSAALAEEGSGGGSFDYGVVYGPNPLNGLTDYENPTYGVQVYASNKFDAALFALGYRPNSSSFSDDNKAYLSNASTGGAFYDFAQLFTNNNTDWGDELVTEPGLVPGFDADVTNFEVALRLNNGTYGADNIWSAEYSTTQRVGAVAAVGLVLSGNVGGGDEPVEPSDDGYIYLDGVLQYTGSPVPDDYKDVVGICIKQTTYNERLTYLNAHEDTSWFVTIGGTMNNGTCGTNFYTSIEPSFGYIDKNTYIEYGIKSPQNYMGSSWRFRYSTVTRTHDGKLYLEFGSIVTNNTYEQQSGGVTDARANPVWAYYYGRLDGSGGNDVPPTNWPETPQNPIPTEPDVPIHTGRGIDDLPEPNDYIEQPTYVTNVFTADLQGVIDALDEHCQHLQNAMYSNFQGFYDDITDFLWQIVQWLGSNINDMLNDLCDYLHDLFEWLADQFDFSVSGSSYNDNTVVSWLRKIYSRLGRGTNTRPTDPVADPFDFGEWLAQLFGNFVGWLFGLGSEAVSGLVEDFETLITKFPFSIPWDLGAMLALLVTAPVTPVFEFPCYTFAGGTISQVGTYRIDLSAWDDVMNTVRPMEVMVFAFWLAFKIDFFKGIIELNKN